MGDGGTPNATHVGELFIDDAQTFGKGVAGKNALPREVGAIGGAHPVIGGGCVYCDLSVIDDAAEVSGSIQRREKKIVLLLPLNLDGRNLTPVLSAIAGKKTERRIQ